MLALEHDPHAATKKIAAELEDAAASDGVASVVLGCGGMVDVYQAVARAAGTRLIDGVRAAASFASQL